MTSCRIALSVDPAHHDRLVAELSDWGAEGFEELDHVLVAFFPESEWDSVEPAVERLVAGMGGERVGPVERLEDRNWNADWEATIQPIDVDPFWIRASWNDGTVPEGRTVVVIDPKMSFGTGYHETTRLMLRNLARFVRPGDRVLDAGTGTGVLGIAALLKGASHCIGFDIDEWSTDNATENALRNDVGDRFEVREGDETTVPETGFGLVMANINRNALLAMLDWLLSRTARDGTLGLSGLLMTDRDDMMDALAAREVAVIAEEREGEWWSVWVRHATGNH
ncbi:MAG: 50S ribosomal protein L11 methyltransferase [Rhodothermales bacterium]